MVKITKEDHVIYNGDNYRLAERLRLARYVVLLLLVLFIPAVFLLSGEDMTEEHFRYLIRNIDFNPDSALSSGNNISYEADTDSRYALYRGSPVILDDLRVRVMDNASGVTLSDYHGFSSARMVCSDRYIFVYDTSFDYVKVYNAFTSVKTLEFPGNVMSVCASDSGNFAVSFIPDDGYYSAVSVFDDSFSEIRRVSKYKNVTGIDMSPDGKLLASTSAYISEDGSMYTEVSVLDVATAESSSFDVRGSAGTRAVFTDDSLAVILDDGVRFYSSDLSVKLTHSYLFRDISGTGRADFYAVTGNSLLLFSDDGAGNGSITVISSDGEIFSDFSLEDEKGIYSVSFGKYTCVMTEKRLLLVSAAEGISDSAVIPDGDFKSLVSDGEAAYLAGDSGAMRVDESLFDSRQQK